ncbi:MAG: polysaccharide deacetylase family protein [Opitutae bacterium]|nr:polysaccharide deacetylase family protein [Opitutae bacterium]
MTTYPPFSWPAGRRGAVCLCWDDSDASQLDFALPILAEFGLRATFYVLPDQVERRLSDWQAALAAGHEIGNHTVRHPCSGNYSWQSAASMVEGYTYEQMEAEIRQANATLHRLLGQTPTSFAYCCGLTFVGRGRAVRSYVPLIADLFTVGRVYGNVSHCRPACCDLAQVWGMGMDNQSFSWIQARIDACCDAGGWLTLVGHTVGTTNRLTVTPDTLRRLCDYLARQPEIWTDTVTTVGNYVRAQQDPSLRATPETGA